MEIYYIFSNCIGAFCFNGKHEIVDSLEFSPEEAISNSVLIEKGMLIESEKKLIAKLLESKKKKGSEKSPDFQIIVLGKNAEKIENEVKNMYGKKVRFSDDKEIILNILESFKSHNYAEKFRKVNLALTKKKIKESVKADLIVIQIIDCIEELNKSANLLSKRLREWYELYAPEVSRNIEDHKKFVKKIMENSREELFRESNLKPNESMGADFSNKDITALKRLAETVDYIDSIIEFQSNYLEDIMKESFPNITAACGALIGAKIIALAGGLNRLAEMPSSKIQVLGAEKALFRHLKTGSKPPKYGIISQHQSIAQAAKSEKGRAARRLSSRIAMAARIDFFRKK